MRKLSIFILVLEAALSANAQDATMPAAPEHPVLAVQGRGVQIYTCKPGSGSGQWVFVAPAARLFDAAGLEVGSHGDGPVWHMLDGSSVLGKAVATSVAPAAGSVPWLLIKSSEFYWFGEACRRGVYPAVRDEGWDRARWEL